MALEKITSVKGTGVYVPGDDIDTDRIIPARFMKCVTFDGLGEFMFYDVRKNEDGTDKQHPLNDPRFEGSSILISGNNFGCGSSREHAPQAIYRSGYKAVIAQGFAEIFFGNSTMLGMPCVTMSEGDIKALAAEIERNPKVEIDIDLVKKEVRYGGKTAPCDIREGNRMSLVAGRWDPIADLLENVPSVDEVAGNLAYMSR